ncbi:MAG: DUF1178 family protein [Chakrabartia sp.]
MIVFDLQCTAHNHVFEAWFAGSDAFAKQRRKGLIPCPFCGDTDVEKAVMAPRIAAKGNRTSKPTTADVAEQSEPTAQEAKVLLAHMVKAQAALLEKSEWVGRDFSNQARAMEAGEIAKGAIHGETSPQEAKALIEEGISILPLPFQVVPPKKLN